MDRREFLGSSTAAAVGLATFGWPKPLAAQMSPKPIGIQIGAVSFLDEGTDKVLDTLAAIGAIDTLFLATFTYGRGIGGRQPRGGPLPDHGKHESTTTITAATSRRHIRSITSAPRSRRRRLRIIRAMTSSPTCCRARRSAG